ncbi:MAG: hypothetical protein U5L45_26915 [Saprospiraceae bacterium]|nr:hypothetical protein [Saprospiraceae bacterium]
MWFVFRLRRKTNHIPLPRASKASARCKKRFLGYAHPSFIFNSKHLLLILIE